MPIGLALHEHEIDRDALLRADFRRRAHVHIVARVFTVVICAIALAGCGCTTRSSMISQTVNSKKVTESKKFTESKSRTPIPLPAAPLLSPQPEPSCEFETTESNADERQKLDYERQCYRHAEMIVRSRLQLLQGSVGETIKAVKRSEWSGSSRPSAPTRTPVRRQTAPRLRNLLPSGQRAAHRAPAGVGCDRVPRHRRGVE